MRSYRNNRRPKFRSNGDRNSIRNIEGQTLTPNTNFQRKTHRVNHHNASRLIEKYNNLAREALSSGDKILSESYFQHSDHFLRILNDREKHHSSLSSEKAKISEDKSKELKDENLKDKKIATS